MNEEFQFLNEVSIEQLPIFAKSNVKKILYNITADQVEDFQMDNRNTNHFDKSHGFFFSDKNLLQGIKARVDLRNPIDLTLNGIFNKTQQAAFIWEVLMDERIENQMALQKLNDEIGLGEIGDVWGQLNSKDTVEKIKQNGYDGIISDITRDSLEYIVFRPEQFQLLTKQAIAETYSAANNKELSNAIDSLKNRQQSRLKI